MAFKETNPITPLSFFETRFALRQGKLTKLPHFEYLLAEESFAKVSMHWGDTRFSWRFDVSRAIEECFFPDYKKGDAIELFLNTHPFQGQKSFSVYCYHFLLLPSPDLDCQFYELSKLKGEETRREILSVDKVSIQEKIFKRGYELELSIPFEELYGMDQKIKHIGFTYRIFSKQSSPQHFAVSSRNFELESHPSLWAQIELK